MNPRNILAILIIVVLLVVVIRLLDRREVNDGPRLGNRTEVGDTIDDAADNIDEGLQDAGRKLEDAVG